MEGTCVQSMEGEMTPRQSTVHLSCLPNKICGIVQINEMAPHWSSYVESHVA